MLAVVAQVVELALGDEVQLVPGEFAGHALPDFFEQPLSVLLLNPHFCGLLLALRLFLRAEAEEAARVRGTLLVDAHVELAARLLALDHHGGGGCRTLPGALGLVVIGRVEDAGPDLAAVIRKCVRDPYGLFSGCLRFLDAKLEAMTTVELGKFLMACALASDLYCPTYLSGATLAKDSNLLKEAAHYKINAATVLGEVREKRLAKSLKPKAEAKGRTSRKAKTNGNASSTT